MTAAQLDTFLELDREAHELARGLDRIAERIEWCPIARVQVPFALSEATYRIERI